MKISLRVQYKGERARGLAAQKDDNSLSPRYLEDLQKDLDHYGVPHPQHTIPVWKTGFVVCVWHVDEGSDVHKGIQRAFQKALHAKDLESRNIGHLAFQDGEHWATTSPNRISKSTHGFKQTYPNLSLNNKNPYPKTSAEASSSFLGSTGSGKAPRPSTSIKMARESASPMTYRSSTSGPRRREASPEEQKYRPAPVENNMAGPSSRPAESSYTQLGQLEADGFQSVDPTQALKQLSQSLAIQNLLRTSSFDRPIKAEPELAVLPPPPPVPVLLPARVPTASSASTSTVVMSDSAQSTTSTAPSVSTAATSMSNGSTNAPAPSARGAVHAATRDLWDVRRQLTAMKAREGKLLKELKELGGRIPEEPTVAVLGMETPEERQRLQDDISGLRAELKRESAARYRAEGDLQSERRRRMHAEDILDDMRREYSAPFIVPALVDVFTKLAQLTGNTLDRAEQELRGGTGPVR